MQELRAKGMGNAATASRVVGRISGAGSWSHANTLSLITTMPTHRTPPASSRVRDFRRTERDCAIQMTRTLHGVPQPYKHMVYGVRRGRARLAGHLPELCVDLVDAGVPLGDALALPRKIEQMCIERRVARFHITLEEAQRDEQDAEHEMNLAQLDVAAHPHDLVKRQRLMDAAIRQEIATAQVRAVLATLDGKTPA